MLVTIACVALVGVAGSAGTYRVQKGDTLSGVAGRLGVSIGSLADANGIRDVHRLVAGRDLVVPRAGAAPAPRTTGTSYVVRDGDTLERIGRRYGVSTSALASANGLRSADLVRIGQRLTIPGRSTATVATAAAAAASTRATAGRLPSRLQAAPGRLALMPHFDRWARAYGVPADLLKAMTWVESGWQTHKISSTGAVGIGQLMPDTVSFVRDVLLRSDLDARVPEHNIRMSARFLRFLLDQNGGRADRALAAYYQGLRSVRERGVFGETRQYVTTVLAVRPAFR